MTFARFTKLACCLMVAATLTACGGGGEKGPQWAQDVKTLLSEPDDDTGVTEPTAQEFVPGTYFSTCQAIPFVLNGDSLQESDMVSYRFVETATGTQLYIKHTLYATESCVDSGNNKQAEIEFPVYQVERAGQTTLTGYSNGVATQGGLLGIRVLIQGAAGAAQITVFNGATLADDVDVDLEPIKVLTSRLGNVLFNGSPLFDESIAKDAIYRKGNTAYFGRQDSSDESFYDELGYPNSVDLDLSFVL